MSILRNLYDRAVVGLDTIKKRFMPFSLIEGADTSDPDSTNVDPSDNNTEPSDFNSTVSSIVSTLRTAALGSGSILLIIALIFAIIVANDAIFLPWFARLFLFFYVFTNMPINPILLLGIPAYYIIRVASNAYSKYQLSPEQRKTDTKPYVGVFYGFLPLLTWKTNSNWTFESLLAPFKIRSIRKLPGKTEPALVPPVKLDEIIYSNTMAEHINYLKELVPGFSVIAKQEFGIALLEAYKTYMMNLNYSSIPPKPVQATPIQSKENRPVPQTPSAPPAIFVPPAPNSPAPNTVLINANPPESPKNKYYPELLSPLPPSA